MEERKILVERGSCIKTRNLIEQAGYTVKQAREDMAELQKTGLTEEFIAETETLLNELSAMDGNHESAKDDISLSTLDVNNKLTEAKDWIRKAKLKAKRVFRLNKTALSDFYPTKPIARSVPNTIEALIKLIELNKKYNAELAIHGGGNEFAAEGEKLLSELKEIDSTQEQIKKNLPEASADLYYKQGLLYYKLKDINDCGQEAFLGNRAKAAQYNMEILNRGGAKRKKEETVAAAAK